MRTSNIFGMAYHFLPRDLSTRATTTEVARGLSVNTNNNTIYMMSGTIPTADELYEIVNSTEFETTYADRIAGKIGALTLSYTYDKRNKERVIRKTPVDAIHWDMTAAGPIGWYAMALTDVDSAVADKTTMFFSDSIGTWTDTERAVIVESLQGSVGDENIFKDYVLSIQDSLKSELV